LKQRGRKVHWRDLRHLDVEDNIKIELREIVCEGIDRLQWLALVNVIMKVGFEVLTALLGNNKQGTACYLLHPRFLLGLFFDPEDGGDMFLRNVGCF
jgi:hypothetical protein